MTDSLDVALRALTAARAGSILLAAGAIALPVAAVVLLARWRLDALVPPYLPDSVLRVRERAPGVSSCDYASATRRWYCSGYF
jgi:hypothetical protein